MRHICVGNLTINGSDNGLSPGRCQPIIWTKAGIFFIGPLGINFREIDILTFLFKKMQLKVLSVKWHPFCLRLNVLFFSQLKGRNILIFHCKKMHIKHHGYIKSGNKNIKQDSSCPFIVMTDDSHFGLLPLSWKLPGKINQVDQN